MNEQIFNPEQFRDATERTAALLDLCNRLLNGDIPGFSFDARGFTLINVADLLAELCQRFPNDYVMETLKDWVLQNRTRLVQAGTEYVNQHIGRLFGNEGAHPVR